jgi:tetratricopeptide (TPR) repeat protein
MLPRDLALLGAAAIERSDRLRAQEALGVPGSALTRATSIRIAESLGTSRAVVGMSELQDGTLTLSLRLLDVDRGTLSAPFRASGALTSAAEMIHGLAWDIALSGPTSPAKSRGDFLALRGKVRFESLAAYGEGLCAADAPARVKLLERALTLDVDNDDARLALGALRLEAREYQAAQDILARVKPASLVRRSARFMQGVALLELGRYHDAAALYATLAADEPTPAVLNNHALALLRAGVPAGPKASDELRKAVEMAPSAPELPFNLGWALFVEGEAEAAAFWMRGVTEKDAQNPRARVVRVWALRQAGRHKQADEEWRALISLAPTYESLASPDLSRRFERILPSERLMVPEGQGRTEAELVALHVGRANKAREAGDDEGAVRELMQAAYLDPYNARAHLLLARAHDARGDKEKAVGELRVSLWCRDDVDVRLELMALLSGIGRTAEARSEAERVLKAQPGNAAARALLDKK